MGPRGQKWTLGDVFAHFLGAPQANWRLATVVASPAPRSEAPILRCAPPKRGQNSSLTLHFCPLCPFFGRASGRNGSRPASLLPAGHACSHACVSAILPGVGGMSRRCPCEAGQLSAHARVYARALGGKRRRARFFLKKTRLPAI